jgi:hypothetical protein
MEQTQTGQMNIEVDKRRFEFSDTFGSDGFFEVGLIKCIETTSKICSLIFGEDATENGFKEMVGNCLPDSTKEFGWRKALLEEINGLYCELPIGVNFHDIEAYANYGILISASNNEKQRETKIKQLIEHAESFLSLIPLKEWKLEAEHLTMIADKALVRWKLDCQQEITAKELALISGRAVQTIKNNLSNNKQILGNEYCIKTKDALSYLVGVKEFKKSIWRDQDDTDILKAINAPLEDIYFVPMATDGTVFNPTLQKDGLFIVGSEELEKTYTSFKKALSHLQEMHTPIWRRPTESGVWTQVKSFEWKRMTALELGFANL